eukprot:CAMPEP_0168167552 /NCGR_PEP_ID=MMETSP0139_2-20121125/2604_1 /TAXON_ID=44445 /ORGANISM="Pseudo-nitzschia australis, Strain 10249 10 AB" /LENGTH=432 /DNA_ID=CAMNT_0008084789 /DNA_START=152 /DNA_END=1450 /DNA_ORIENTATION=+
MTTMWCLAWNKVNANINTNTNATLLATSLLLLFQFCSTRTASSVADAFVLVPQHTVSANAGRSGMRGHHPLHLVTTLEPMLSRTRRRRRHMHHHDTDTNNHNSRVPLSAAKSNANNNNNNKISSEEVRRRNIEQLDKLRTRDRQSRTIPPGELSVVFEDEHIVCVNKPPGVLCVPSVEGVDIPTLAQAVFEFVPNRQPSLDHMVVHRLGMDTSGLVVFAKTMESLRGMNTLFRTRKITRQYEALVCGHLGHDSGVIDLPLMRDYEKPPFMRISTDQHQRVLLDLDDAIVGKKLLEAPKASRTEYQVIAREYFEDDSELPVTRLLLTSVTGRTHQLNVHMAAIGHPIVGDRIYGVDGDAVPNGGLEEETPSSDDNNTTNDTYAARQELERAIGAKAVNMCVHAKCLSFQHPMLNNESDADQDPSMYFECEAPF